MIVTLLDPLLAPLLADVAPATEPVLGAGHVAVIMAIGIVLAVVALFVWWVRRATPPND